MIRFFVQRNSLSYALFFFICIIGLFSLKIVPRQDFPDVNMDILSVRTIYPGASSQDVETNITDLIEEELEKVSGIEEMISASMPGVSIIQIKFSQELTKSQITTKKEEVKRAVWSVRGLPEGLEGPPIIDEKTSSDFPLLEVGITSTNYEKARHHARNLRDKLRMISGVGQVSLLGDLTREIHIICKAEKLKKYQVSLAEVHSEIACSDMYVSGGSYNQEEQQLSVICDSSIQTLDQVKEWVIRGSLDHKMEIKIKDIAEVRFGFKPEKQQVYINGKKGIVMVISRQESFDTIRLAKQVYDVIDENKKEGIDYHKLFNSSSNTKQLFKVILRNGLIGLAVVFVVLFIFLDLSMAIFVAIGVPFCILGSIALFPLLGLTINMLTLIGFVLVLGMLVDDAIVIGESIQTYKEKGLKGCEAAIKGVKRVISPVFFTIASTIVCFIPLIFMKGILGKFVYSIPVVVIVCLLFSLFESAFLLPAHTGHIKNKAPQKGWLTTRLQIAYKKYLLLAFRYRLLFIFLFVLSMTFLCLFAFKTMKFDLFPKRDSNILLISFEGNRKWNLDEMREHLVKYENVLTQEKEIKQIIEGIKTQVGILKRAEGRSLGETRPFWGYMVVFLKDYRIRKWNIRQIESHVRNLFLDQDKELTYRVYSVKGGPPVGADITINILSKSHQKNTEFVKRIVNYLQTRKGVQNIDISQKQSSDQLRVIPNQRKAKQLGLTVKQIAHHIALIGEGKVTKSRQIEGERTDIRVLLNQVTQSQIKSIKILNSRGKLIRLSDVCDIKREPSIGTIYHFSGLKSIEISADVIEGVTTSTEENALLKKLFVKEAKESEVFIQFGGSEKETQKSFQAFILSFIVSFLVIYLLLILFFNSLVQPFIILLLIPFGVISVIIVFSLHGMPLSFLGTIGILGLIGVMINDAMVMLSALKEISKDSMSVQQIVERATDRLRPVLLTTITTVAGLLPTVYGWGGKELLIVPLAMSIGWGLVIVTLVTLFVVPIVFSFAIFSGAKIK